MNKNLNNNITLNQLIPIGEFNDGSFRMLIVTDETQKAIVNLIIQKEGSLKFYDKDFMSTFKTDQYDA